MSSNAKKIQRQQEKKKAAALQKDAAAKKAEIASLIEEENYTEAADKLAELVTNKVIDGDIAYQVAYCYFMTGDYRRAESWINNALTYAPAHKKARLLLGRLCIIESRSDDAFAIYEFVLDHYGSILDDEEKEEIDDVLSYYGRTERDTLVKYYPKIAAFLNIAPTQEETAETTPEKPAETAAADEPKAAAPAEPPAEKPSAPTLTLTRLNALKEKIAAKTAATKEILTETASEAKDAVAGATEKIAAKAADAKEKLAETKAAVSDKADAAAEKIADVKAALAEKATDAKAALTEAKATIAEKKEQAEDAIATKTVSAADSIMTTLASLKAKIKARNAAANSVAIATETEKTAAPVPPPSAAAPSAPQETAPEAAASPEAKTDAAAPAKTLIEVAALAAAAVADKEAETETAAPKAAETAPKAALPAETPQTILDRKLALIDKIRLLNYFAAAHFADGRYDEAEEFLAAALGIDDRDAATLRNLAVLQAKTGNRAAAIETAARLPVADFVLLSVIAE